ncbi:hypothetical protein GEV33_012013 [Tenebrio molitor]|uniref:Uncharacterized protein n=1 Tax=Tenebrio molitor TaxID=7067 RepID=A0A8J6HA34_TENMO|nr:hypothetical protein GEV33_012013 [Tenebrio molitor]
MDERNMEEEGKNRKERGLLQALRSHLELQRSREHVNKYACHGKLQENFIERKTRQIVDPAGYTQLTTLISGRSVEIAFCFQKTLSELWHRNQSRAASSRTYTSVLSKCPSSARQFQRSASDGVADRLQGDFNLRPADSHRSYTFLGCNKVQQNSAVIDCASLRPIVLSEAAPRAPQTRPKPAAPGPHDKFRILRLFGQRRRYNGHFLRQGSVDSSHTISNSSLQDVDEIDYSSSDLVRYMEEINEDIA